MNYLLLQGGGEKGKEIIYFQRLLIIISGKTQ